jgi:hypothetical protein
MVDVAAFLESVDLFLRGLDQCRGGRKVPFEMGPGAIALGLVAITAALVVAVFPNVRAEIGRMILGTIILLFGLAIAALMVIAITRFDLDPLLRSSADLLSRHQAVDFYTLITAPYRVEKVLSADTDSDGQNEWVVFYRFDLTDGRSPCAAAVYDYDRGSPPAIFPYRLVPPDRDYLSEGEPSLELQDVVKPGEPEDKPAKELLVYGRAGGLTTDLTIFRHVPNSFQWEPPRDVPPRYQVVGAFRGDGGVAYDPATRRVTVTIRSQDRSQLAVEEVYALDETRGSYMSAFDPKQLGPPISQRVTFAFGMPEDVLDTPYPEKIVLGFYEMLGQKPPAISPDKFLTGQALIEYNKRNLDYFGFRGAIGDLSEVKVTKLEYTTEVEQFDPSMTVLGEQPRFLVVGVTFDAWRGNQFIRVAQPIRLVAVLVNGKWRIDRLANPG